MNNIGGAQMNNKKIGKLIITGIVAMLSAISGYADVEIAKAVKRDK